MGNVEQLYDLLNQIPVTSENQDEIEEIKQALSDRNYITALTKIKNLKMMMSEAEKDEEQSYQEDDEEEDGEVVILKVEDTDSEDEESYVSVDDQEILNKVFEIFKEKFKDEFNFIDED